jgi:hypothetical protein
MSDTPPESNVVRESYAQFRMRCARYETRIIAMLLFALFIGVHRLWARGAHGNWLLLIAPVASFFGMGFFSSSLFGTTTGPPVPSWPKAFANWSGLIPFFFGIYLTLVQGIWSAWVALRDNHALSLLASLCFLIGGWLLLKNLADISDLYPALRQGKLVVEWPKPGDPSVQEIVA